MKTKTAHQLALELLAGPDLPIYHFDPSRAGIDDENDTSLSDPVIERNTLDGEEIESCKGRAEELGLELLTDWLTICGETDEARIAEGSSNPFDPKTGHAVADMINAFLKWPLPESVSVDACCLDTKAKHRVGTNMLTCPEAMQMIQEVVCPIIAKYLPATPNQQPIHHAKLPSTQQIEEPKRLIGKKG
jgi:hypothetical protein